MNPPRIDETMAMLAFLCFVRRVNDRRWIDADEPREALQALGIAVRVDPDSLKIKNEDAEAIVTSPRRLGNPGLNTQPAIA